MGVRHIIKIEMNHVIFVEYSLEAFIILVVMQKSVLYVVSNSQFVNAMM